MPKLTRITRDARVMGGKPCIAEALSYAAWRATEIKVPLGGSEAAHPDARSFDSCIGVRLVLL